jgi:hypothetical protein
MNPTFAHTVRLFLRDLDRTHRPPTEGERDALALADRPVPPANVTGRQHVGPLDCPDCTRGLVSRGHDLICITLPRQTALRGCHPGCVVAYGVDRDGVLLGEGA